MAILSFALPLFSQNLVAEDEFHVEVERNLPHSIPCSMLEGPWSVVACKPWNRVEPQAILEGRGISWTIKHIVRNSNYHNMRHVILTDATTSMFAMTKGRSSSYLLNRVCRHVAAHLLATNCRVYLRWIQSEANLADQPSRGIPVPGYFHHDAQDSGCC